MMLIWAVVAPGQGTITFNASSGLSSTYYNESGMWFHVIIPSGSAYDNMAIVGPTPPGGNAPQNVTPYMGWFRQFNPTDYVSLSLTNGSALGLTSVQLADPISPSLSPVSISFLGFKQDGSTVTNTFTTPGNGASTFLSYQFNSAFASGLTSVSILANRWAMDNLAFTVPEPSVVSLALLSGGLFIYVRLRNRYRP
jgi:hypothetical protein